MFSYLKKYLFSIIVIAAILYLSLFKPPKTKLDNIPNIDKVAHICMYAGLSGVIWLEYLLSHKKNFRLKPILLGGVVFPILLSGCIELIQEYCTTYRGGDWMDFAANSTGAILASAIGYYILRPKLILK